MPFRGKRYVGGHGAEWINEFCRDAPTAFPWGSEGSSLAPPRELEIDPMGIKGITRKERQLHSAHGSAVWRTFPARTFLAT
jgi:hypothetical protein